MEKIFRAAKYIRSSCAYREEEQNNTVIHQSLIIDNFLLEYRDIIVVSERIDENYSGVSFERPAYKEMVADIVSGKIDCVICKDLTRLGRNFVEVGRCLGDLFPAYGVRFISINDDIDTFRNDIRGDMLVALKNIFSEEYCRDISIKTRSALDYRRRQGDCVSASAIYGYQKDKSNKHKLVLDEFTASVVQSIFSMKLNGMSAAGIASKLTESGISPPLLYKRGNGKGTPKWHPGTVQRILKDENYTGTLVQGRQTIYSYKVRKIVNNPENEWIKTTDAHESIVSHGDFEQVQRLLRLDTRIPQGKESVYPFSGLLICACCNGNMIRKTVRTPNNIYAYYCCTTGKRNGCLSAGRINEYTLFSEVAMLIKDYIRKISVVDSEKYVERVTQLRRDEQLQNIAELEGLLAQNNQFKSGLSDSLLNEVISQEEYTQYRLAYNKKNDQLSLSIDCLKTSTYNINKQIKNFSEWLCITKKYNGLVELNRAAVVHMVHSIVISGNTEYQIRFNYQDEWFRLMTEMGHMLGSKKPKTE